MPGGGTANARTLAAEKEFFKMMQLCSRCRKRMAVVFVTKLENGESKNEGLSTQVAQNIAQVIRGIDECVE